MIKTDAIVLNHIGGGMSVWVDKLPSVGESVMGYEWHITEDLAKGGNVAVALSRLGLSSAIIGKIGKDEAGDRDVKWLKDAGVILDGLIQTSKVQTGQGIGINERITGRNLIVTGTRSSDALDISEVESIMKKFQPAKFFITGFEVREELALESAKLAKLNNSKVVLNPSPVPKNEIGEIEYVDYLILNEVEGRRLLGIEDSDSNHIDYEEITRQLVKKYKCRNIVMTLGNEGYVALEGDSYYGEPSIAVETIIDSSGAGDGFLAAMVANLHWGSTLKDACKWANKYAARTVMFKGTLPGYSTIDELKKFYKNRGEDFQ